MKALLYGLYLLLRFGPALIALWSLWSLGL